MSEPMLGQRMCSNGHQVRAAARFCPACGVNTAPPERQQTVPAWPTVDPSWPSAAPPVPAVPPRRVPWGGATLVVLLALVLGAGGATAGVYLHGRPDPATAKTAQTHSAAPTPTAPPTATPPTPTPPTPTRADTWSATPPAPPTTNPTATMIGVVDVTAVREDGRTAAVGAVLNEYFGGINTRDLPRVLAVMDPTGVVDRTDPRQVEQFRVNVSTTTDTAVVLHWIRVEAGGTWAGVTFTSRQDARYGPNGQTCTNWSLTYQLSGELLILRTTGTNQPCRVGA